MKRKLKFLEQKIAKLESENPELKEVEEMIKTKTIAELREIVATTQSDTVKAALSGYLDHITDSVDESLAYVDELMNEN